MVAPWILYNAALGGVVELHADDFHAAAPEQDLEDLRGRLGEVCSLKHAAIVGRWGAYTHLGVKRVVGEDGTYLYPNSKHIDSILATLGLDGVQRRGCAGAYSERIKG